MKLAGLQTARIARALSELGPNAHEAALPVPHRHDRCRQPRRRAAVHCARRPRAASAQLRTRRHARPASSTPPLFPTTRRTCSWSTTTAASATCCRASCSARATASPRRRSAADARAKLEGLRFDLLILDVMMPGETGFELAARSAHVVERADPDADRARRGARAASRGSRSAPTTMSASRSSRASCRCGSPTSCKRARPARDAGGRNRALRRVRLPHRARRAQARRRGHPPHRPRARHAARCWPRRRARPCRGWRSPATAAATGERAVDVQVNRLRRKIERDPANPLLVQTVRGIGYRLVTTP